MYVYTIIIVGLTRSKLSGVLKSWITCKPTLSPNSALRLLLLYICVRVWRIRFFVLRLTLIQHLYSIHRYNVENLNVILTLSLFFSDCTIVNNFEFFVSSFSYYRQITKSVFRYNNVLKTSMPSCASPNFNPTHN